MQEHVVCSFLIFASVSAKILQENHTYKVLLLAFLCWKEREPEKNLFKSSLHNKFSETLLSTDSMHNSILYKMLSVYLFTELDLRGANCRVNVQC